MDRQYFVSRTYNSMLTGTGCGQVAEGTIVYYVNRTSTDQVAGFMQETKHSVGRKQMREQVAAARWLPFQRRTERGEVDLNQHQLTPPGIVPPRRLRQLGRRRHMDIAVRQIDRRPRIGTGGQRCRPFGPIDQLVGDPAHWPPRSRGWMKPSKLQRPATSTEKIAAAPGGNPPLIRSSRAGDAALSTR